MHVPGRDRETHGGGGDFHEQATALHRGVQVGVGLRNESADTETVRGPVLGGPVDGVNASKVAARVGEGVEGEDRGELLGVGVF